MMGFVLYLAVFTALAGAAAPNRDFTSSGEMSITSCPITYYGQKYQKVYLGFNESRFAVCFNGLYKPGIKNDCILMSGGGADRGGLSVLTKEIPIGSGVHRLLPNLKQAGKCVNVIPLQDSQQSQVQQVELGNFGAQSILAIKTYSGYTNVNVETDALVNGVTVSTQTFQTAETSRGVIADMTGCRLSGNVYQTNTTVEDPSICSTVTCDESGLVTAASYCGPTEQCNGDGSCTLNAVCTVIASSVMDFGGRLHAVSDRCGYALLRSSVLPGLQVLGVFKERRRSDVSFLDRVVLGKDGAEISLEQGGRVQVDGDVLMLNESQMIHGVEFSKDHVGVTAKIEAFNYTVSVLFDGNTAIIQMAGPHRASASGLCGNSDNSLGQDKVLKYSTPDCDAEHNETLDSTTDCATSTKWCNLLRKDPFTTCNSYIDPESFISACTHTLCKYPAVDDLRCQFLGSYAQTCRRHANVSMKDWRSKTPCSAYPRAACQDKFCSPHEFCGVDTRSGETRCHCRALFASKYKPTNSFGEPMTCEKNSASVMLANCLLKDKGISYSMLHLNDKSCKGDMDNLTHMVKFTFNSENTCGTLIMANESQIIYKNIIMAQNFSRFGGITRHDKVQMDFSCFYTQPEVRTLAIRFRHSSVVQHISAGEWNYSLTMDAYTSPDRIKPIDSSSDVELNQKLWVEVKTTGLDANTIALITESCWATDEPSPDASLRYDLIINGCPSPADETVKVKDNGQGTSNHFSFNTFQFSGTSGNVYLHCKVQLCVRTSDNCIQRCGQAHRRRRSAVLNYETRNSAFITMTWTY